MSDFDNEKTGGQERPDYYQPNQNEGKTYYTPPQNEQADNNTLSLFLRRQSTGKSRKLFKHIKLFKR